MPRRWPARPPRSRLAARARTAGARGRLERRIHAAHAASPKAARIWDAYWLLVASGRRLRRRRGALVVFIVRYRSRGRAAEVEGPQIHGHTRLEIVWTLVPVLILAVIAVFVFSELPGSTTPAAARGPVHVRSRGASTTGATSTRTAASLDRHARLPTGPRVDLDVGARPDVIHSWWVPALNGKIDAIPGPDEPPLVQADQDGRFEGRCAELCGIQHTK